LIALAYIKAAQAIRTELHLRDEVVSAEMVDTQIQKAQDAYEKASAAAVIPAMKAMAQFVQGLCAEERGQTQQAADIYKAIADDETFAATIFPKMAQSRLESLDDNAESFTFVEAQPEPESVEAPVSVTPEAVSQPAPAATSTPAPETPTEKTDSQN